MFGVKYLSSYRSVLKPIWNVVKKASHYEKQTENTVARGGQNLKGQVIGLVGYGAIAREFITLLKHFGCKIKVYSEYLDANEAEKLGIESVTLDDALNANIVSLHRGLSERTRKSFGKRELDQLKPGTVLINASRGEIFDEKALIERLKRGDIFACLDVFEVEPLPKNSVLRKMPNVFLTSHISGSTKQMYEDATEIVIRKVTDFLSGKQVKYAVKTSGFLRNMT